MLLGPIEYYLHKVTFIKLGNVMHRNGLRELGKMRRQTEMFHMNEKEITSEKETNKVKMVIYMLKSSR